MIHYIVLQQKDRKRSPLDLLQIRTDFLHQRHAQHQIQETFCLRDLR